MKKSKFKKFCMIAVFLILEDWLLSVLIYHANFSQRSEIPEEQTIFAESPDDSEEIQRTEYKFNSDKNQQLTGYLYRSGENQKGMIILAHGLNCGGHQAYEDYITDFVQNGYYVFAYDATGNGESEGAGTGGLPQGVIDLDHAITFVEETILENPEFPDLPIALFGHSWGGYSVCNVLLYHPEIRAVVACAGFNSSSDMLEYEGQKQAGAGIWLMLPFMKLHERIKFGGYATHTAIDGLDNTQADILIVHCKDDETVPTEYGYDLFYQAYHENPRFSFILHETGGHEYFRLDQLVDFYDTHLK